ncbi:single-stranded DNA-binding protein [Agromyces sp. ZXT2-6]|uniref:single-stranded DNA-binding protein n=1 Tax=Agromyces sp. ZXT2-6 TaxID=3461153 RepID=UPI004054B81E
MTDLVTVTGFVGNDPRHNVTDAGLAITNFRLASTRRYFDRAKGEWADGETNWYSVAAFRQLAVNAAASVSRGDRVVVHGRLRVRPWETGEKSGTAVEIDADAIGHDLSWGRTSVTRTAAIRAVDDGDRAAAAGDSEAGAAASAGEDAWTRPGTAGEWPGDRHAAAPGSSPADDAAAGTPGGLSASSAMSPSDEETAVEAVAIGS